MAGKVELRCVLEGAAAQQYEDMRRYIDGGDTELLKYALTLLKIQVDAHKLGGNLVVEIPRRPREIVRPSYTLTAQEERGER